MVANGPSGSRRLPREPGRLCSLWCGGSGCPERGQGPSRGDSRCCAPGDGEPGDPECCCHQQGDRCHGLAHPLLTSMAGKAGEDSHCPPVWQGGAGTLRNMVRSVPRWYFIDIWMGFAVHSSCNLISVSLPTRTRLTPSGFEPLILVFGAVMV